MDERIGGDWLACGGDWLVAYADGELVACGAAEEHLASCAACRREVRRLRASRETLEGFLVHLRAKGEADSRGSVARRLRRRQLAAGWVAAAVALMLCLRLMNTFHRTTPSVPDQPTANIPVETAPADVDVLAQIDRETQIAKLQTAISILASEPGMDDRRQSLEMYLRDSYNVAAGETY